MKELEFNKIGSTDRENGEVFKSGSNRHLIQPMRYRSGDLWIAVVMIVGRTPTAVTHKPIARPRKVQLVCSTGRRTTNDDPLWDLGEMRVVMIVGQTPTAMTDKPIARPNETPS